MQHYEKSFLFNNKCLTSTLIVNVKNAPEIRKKLLSGELPCTIIKPNLIVDLIQIYVAANKALLADSKGKLTTKSLYTEILFNLSLSKNISQSLLRFGIDDKDSQMIIVTFEDDAEVKRILSEIIGDQKEIGELKNLTNTADVCKVYKISDMELNVSSLINLVVSKISTKDFVNQ